MPKLTQVKAVSGHVLVLGDTFGVFWYISLLEESMERHFKVLHGKKKKIIIRVSVLSTILTLRS